MKTGKKITNVFTVALMAMAMVGMMAGTANAADIIPSSYSYDIDPIWDDAGGANTLLTDGDYAVGGNATIAGWWNQADPTITFVLDGTYDLQTIVFTGTSQWGAGIASLDISVSTDGATYTDLTNFGGSYTGTPFTRSLDVSAMGNAQYVRVKIIATAVGAWRMFSEVDFDGTAAGPTTTAGATTTAAVTTSSTTVAVTTSTTTTAGPFPGASYSADIGPFASAPWNDAGGDPTAPGGVAWAVSELFDNDIQTGGNGNVVGWHEGSTGAPTLTFDLGGLYALSTIDVWRRVGNGTVTDLTISVSTDDVTYSTPVPYTPATWAGNQATIDLSAFADAQYVRMKLGPDAVAGGWLMLTEVAFDATPAVSIGTVIAIR